MSKKKSALTTALELEQYPRSSNYDPEWVLENLMGPNVLWLTEAVTEVMYLQAGMRVLDLGCGKAVSSIFLAKEFGVKVWATDLWIPASENWQRIKEANLAESVFPIHAEAHSLPFAHGFFDAVVSLDAYHYFGTDDLYLNYFAPFVRPDGQLGIVVPGLTQEFSNGLPKHLEPFWYPDFWSFHSPDWWRKHWEKSGQVEVRHADLIPDSWRQWLRWLKVCEEHSYPSDPQSVKMLEADKGRNLGFTRLLAHKLDR